MSSLDTNTKNNSNFVSEKATDKKKESDVNKPKYQKSESKRKLDKLRKSQNFRDLGDAFDYFSD